MFFKILKFGGKIKVNRIKQESVLDILPGHDLIIYLVGRQKMARDLCFYWGEDAILFSTVTILSEHFKNVLSRSQYN